MTRLVHSEAGYVRSLQISRTNFFAFVEGGLDRPFFDRLLAQAFSGTTIKYEVIAAKELPSQTGGKISVLKQFRVMQRRNTLSAEAFGKRFVSVFFVDKDIDDVTRTKTRSKHVVYTPTYDIEGHLFDRGDLARAVADACGMTCNQALTLIGNQKIWIEQCVVNWKAWTILCMISQVRKINCGCTFDRLSDINPNFTQPTDNAKLDIFKVAMQNKLGLSNEKFEQLFVRFVRQMTRSIQAKTPLRYFKGKWLKVLLERHLRQGDAVPDANINSAGDKVTSTLVAQVGLTKSCHFINQYSVAVLALANGLA